jgi:GMC oxidoreductase
MRHRAWSCSGVGVAVHRGPQGSTFAQVGAPVAPDPIDWTKRQTAAQPMGGTTMGPGASNSVTNSYGQTHDIADLHIAGPGIFPTAGASNATYTIFALSLRGAEPLVRTWSAVAGGVRRASPSRAPAALATARRPAAWRREARAAGARARARRRPRRRHLSPTGTAGRRRRPWRPCRAP